jgi:hypothetical protein
MRDMMGALRDRQLKISVEADLADAFKASCAVRGVSMASEISLFMQENSGARAPARTPGADETSTRRRRRNAVAGIVARLRGIADAEDSYRENIPDNLRSGMAYESASAAVDAIEEAIALLDEAFS